MPRGGVTRQRAGHLQVFYRDRVWSKELSEISMLTITKEMLESIDVLYGPLRMLWSFLLVQVVSIKTCSSLSVMRPPVPNAASVVKLARYVV